MNEQDQTVLLSRLVPQPQKVVFFDGPEYHITNNCPMRIIGPKTNDILKFSKLYWDIVPKIMDGGKNPESMAPEAYSIKITEKEIILSYSDVSGARNALKTLRQLAEVERGRETFSFYLLPQAEIKDSPAMPFRSIHLCWFPEIEIGQIEKDIRLAAYYKLNYVILEFWGTFPFQSHPELCWEKYTVNADEIRRLIILSNTLGITLIPQFNILGHASGASIGNGKHVVLNTHPHMQPLFEPDGWTWCLSNPATRKFLLDAVSELHDFFGNPPYFHIGFDEAFNIRSCAACRKRSLHDLFKEHLLFFHDFFTKRNTRIIMWHDMLLNHHDKRWDNDIIHDRAPINLEPLLTELPKDIIIADWQYKYQKINDKEPAWESARFFKKLGFDVLLTAWNNEEGTLSMGRMGAKENFMGMIASTWNQFSGISFCRIYSAAAQSSWHGNWHKIGNADDWQMCNFHVRQMDWDMNVTEYSKIGTAKKMALN